MSDRLRDLHAFDDTKAGVKGLLDAGTVTVPSIFHHHPDATPVSATGMSIPVVDLAAGDREQVVAQLRAAAETVGFFQVLNHGVPLEVLDEMLASVRRFNEEPAEAKRPYYTRDPARKVRYSSNFDLFLSPAANWRDTLFVEQAAPYPPRPEELPAAVRGVMLRYVALVQELASRVLLELLSEALGLPECGRLRDMGCAEGVNVVCNYYPPCPQPDLTVGTSRHSDPSFITVLLQDAMGGLQALLPSPADDAQQQHGNGWCWVDVPPLPGALVINVGDLLQLVSNGRFKSVEHRVLANRSSETARVSVASFCNANLSSQRLYGPIDELISEEHPPVYRTITLQEFMGHFYGKGLDGRPSLHSFLMEG